MPATNPRLLLLVPTTTYRAEAFVHAAKRLPVDLSIASEEPSALSDLHPVDLPAFDFGNPDSVLAFVERFAREQHVDAVVAVDDGATMAASLIADRLGLAGNPITAAYAARNKYRMRELMRRRGAPTPDYRLVPVDADIPAIARELDYPVVLKPLMMAASRGVLRADDPHEFAEAFARVARIIDANDAPTDREARHHVLVEEFIPGWEVALEGMLTEGGLDVITIFDKPDPLDGPIFPETIYTTPSRLPAESQHAVVEATRMAVRALGLRHGPVHAELRGDGTDVWLVEVAARSIGGLCSRVLRFEGGRTLEDVILQHALGFERSLPPLAGPAAGVMMLQPPAPGRLTAINGLDAAREVEGIDEAIASAHPGRRLRPLPEGFLYVGFLFARAATPARAEAALREAAARVEIVVEPD